MPFLDSKQLPYKKKKKALETASFSYPVLRKTFPVKANNHVYEKVP
jgi:hypothetical protein